MTDLRKIDALVAEHVMGWPVVEGVSSNDLPNGEGTDIWILGTFAKAPDGFKSLKLWRPSEDIAAAWEMVERFTKETEAKGAGPIVEVIHDGRWNAGIGLAKAFADTAPLAICLAALAARGIKYDKE